MHMLRDSVQLALAVVDHALLHRAQNADVVSKTPKVAGSVTQKTVT